MPDNKNRSGHLSMRSKAGLKKIISQSKYQLAGKIYPRKVSFIIVGAQKSGTTALWRFLEKSPDISLSSVKETNFFSTESYWNGGHGESFYHSFFELFPRHPLGEASPSYLLNHEKVAPRIKAYNPNIKLIFILRNPSERAYSQYRMHVRLYGLKLPFTDCIRLCLRETPNGIASSNEFETTNDIEIRGEDEWLVPTIKTYLKFGDYASQIKTYLEQFDRKNLLFLATNELQNYHDETMVTRLFQKMHRECFMRITMTESGNSIR